MRRLGGLLSLMLLAGCGHAVIPAGSGPGYGPPPKHRGTSGWSDRSASGSKQLPVTQPVAATPISAVPVPAAPADATNAVSAGIVPGPALSILGISQADAERALTAFRLSCPTLMRRTDVSGLTRGSDWSAVCNLAQTTSDRDALRFFIANFETAQVSDGRAFATGYFEPEIAGSLKRSRRYDAPIYGKPADLVTIDLGQFSDKLAGKKIRGHVQGDQFVPYFDRGQIDDGALAGRGLELAWAADPIELFFMEVQGSGRVRLPNGQILRLGYASQNGRDYTGIGKLMRERGLLAPGKANMQGIIEWLRAHPSEGRAIMRENKSYVFFRVLDGPGPLGALGLPVTGKTSVAADPHFIPLGAPVFLSMDRTDATGLWVAQDTGGAIKGANRFDTFWGAGPQARSTAGGMSAHGTAFILLPIGTLARLGINGRATP